VPSTRSAAIKVVAIVGSGIVINKLSDQFDSAAPLVILASFLALPALVLYESRTASEERKEGKDTREILDLLKFCLASLLLGALIAVVAMLPIFHDRYVHSPLNFVVSDGAPDFHLFELGAAGCITLLGILAAVRRGSPTQLMAFLTSAIAGMTLAIAMYPTDRVGFSFTFTFLGWLAGATVFAFCAYLMPDIVRLYSGFWFKPIPSESVEPDVPDGQISKPTPSPPSGLLVAIDPSPEQHASMTDIKPNERS
jgi:hypothetical protein